MRLTCGRLRSASERMRSGLNAYALTVAHRFQRERTNQNARKIFLTSLWYLPCTLMLFLLHSKTWDDEALEKNQNALSKFFSDQIHAARAKGRELCLHEASVHKGSQACPVVVGKKTTRDTVEQATERVSEVTAAERLTVDATIERGK